MAYKKRVFERCHFSQTKWRTTAMKMDKLSLIKSDSVEKSIENLHVESQKRKMWCIETSVKKNRKSLKFL